MIEILGSVFLIYLVISVFKDSKPDKYEGKPERGASRKVCIAWNTLHPDDPVEVPDEDDI